MGQTNEKCAGCGSDVGLNEVIPFHEKVCLQSPLTIAFLLRHCF